MMISDAILVDNYLFSLPLAYGNKEKRHKIYAVERSTWQQASSSP
jgi:hypothetical protein